VDRRRPIATRDVLAGGVSVVIACHSEARVGLLEQCVDSALDQEVAPREVVIAVDNNDVLYHRLRSIYRSSPRVRVVANVGSRGASAARNCGVRAARCPIIAFLDDDVVADPAWLRRLIAPLSDPTVVGTGGRAFPRWQTSQPRWFPEEFLWVVGASFKGMPDETAPVRNVWSENMAVRRAPFLGCGGFREGFGKQSDVSSPEDTEMCIRFARRSGDRWMYVPDARVEHYVPQLRATFGFFVRRCHNEGRGKVEMRRFTRGGLTAERTYALRTVPAALVRYAGRVVRGDVASLLRFGAVLIGSAAALVGAMQAVVRGSTPQPVVVPARHVQSRAG
jgi:GT2 family glycosyltransferase